MSVTATGRCSKVQLTVTVTERHSSVSERSGLDTRQSGPN